MTGNSCNKCHLPQRLEAKFCNNCGAKLDKPKVEFGVDIQEHAKGMSAPQSFWQKLDKKSKVVFVSIAALALVFGFSSGFSGGNGGDGGGLTVDFFGCSIGTRAASTIVKSTLPEQVYAYVTVGLYSEDGTLVHSATDYGLVEAGGKSVINVSLSPYQNIGTTCRVIEVGY